MQEILTVLATKETLESYQFAQATGRNHQSVVGAIKSLQSIGNVESNKFSVLCLFVVARIIGYQRRAIWVRAMGLDWWRRGNCWKWLTRSSNLQFCKPSWGHFTYRPYGTKSINLHTRAHMNTQHNTPVVHGQFLSL